MHSNPALTRKVALNPASIAGLLLFIMILCSLVADFVQGTAPELHTVSYLAAGLAAWSAALLLFPLLRKVQKIQISLFLLVGLGLMFYSFSQGIEPAMVQALSRNTALIAMILSVGFLKLVLLGNIDAESPAPVGRRSFLHTLLAVSVFGSIINISAPIIIGDRLTVRRPMNLFTARSITRVFCTCASWSPFFAGMAVVLTYVGDVQLLPVMLGGFPFMAATVALVYYKALYSDPQEVARFVGYPLQLQSLLVPALLAFAVLLASLMHPELSILTVIAVSALILTSVLLLRHGPVQALSLFVAHIKNNIPLSVNEVLLFLAAGVLATGLVMLMQSVEIVLPISEFTPSVAAGLLALMIGIAAVGLHPVIQISVLTPLVLVTNPPAELLALTYLFAWSLGTLASPLSGTHLVFQGRFGIPAWRGAVQNWGFVLVMYLLAIVILHIFSTVLAAFEV